MAIKTFSWPGVSINSAGLATEAKQDIIIAELIVINGEQVTQTQQLQDINDELDLQTIELQDINTELNSQTVELQDINTELNSQTIELQDINTELNTQTTELQTLNAVDFATSAKQDDVIAELVDVNTSLDTVNVSLADILTEVSAINDKTSFPKTVQQLDAVLLDVSSSNIPASSSLPRQIVASTTADVQKIQIIEDIGEFMGLYVGFSASEVLVCSLPLGGGEVLVNIPSGSRISIRALQNTAIATNTFLAMNLINIY